MKVWRKYKGKKYISPKPTGIVTSPTSSSPKLQQPIEEDPYKHHSVISNIDALQISKLKKFGIYIETSEEHRRKQLEKLKNNSPLI